MKRGLSEIEAGKRVAAQMPVAAKLALATERIDCSGPLEETGRQVEALAKALGRASQGK
jgi:dephospho-CoA kinase